MKFRNSTTGVVGDYLNAGDAFSKMGGDYRTVQQVGESTPLTASAAAPAPVPAAAPAAPQVAGGDGTIQYGPDGKPIYPGIKSLLDPEGNLKDQYRVKGGIDTSVLEGLRGQANAAPGSSAWEKMQLEKQRLDEGNLLDKTAKGAKTAFSTGASGLATTGGMSAGARMALAKGTALGGMQAGQGVLNQGALARLGIGNAAEDRRLDIAKGMPGMELGLSDYNTGLEKYNKGGAVSENQRQDLSKLGAYSEAMKAWAAEKTGNAQAASGKKG